MTTAPRPGAVRPTFLAPASRRTRAPLSLLLAVLVLVTGCTGYRTYLPGDFSEWPPQEGTTPDVLEPGKQVHVATASDAVVSGTLESVGADSLVVAGRSVPFAEITKVQIRGFLWEPSFFVLATTVAAGAVVFRPHGEFAPDAAIAPAR